MAIGKRSREDSPPATSKSKGRTRAKKQKHAVRNGMHGSKLDDDLDAPPSALPTASTHSFNDTPRRVRADSVATTFATDDEGGYETERVITRPPSPVPQREAGLAAESTESNIEQDPGTSMAYVSGKFDDLKVKTKNEGPVPDGSQDKDEDSDEEDGATDHARLPTPVPDEDDPTTPRAREQQLAALPPTPPASSSARPSHKDNQPEQKMLGQAVVKRRRSERGKEYNEVFRPRRCSDPNRGAPFVEADEISSSQESNSTTTSEKEEAVDLMEDPDTSFDVESQCSYYRRVG